TQRHVLPGIGIVPGVETTDSGRVEDNETAASGSMSASRRSPRDLPVSTSVIRVVRGADVHPGPAVPREAVGAPAAERQAKTDNARDPEPATVPPTPVAAATGPRAAACPSAAAPNEGAARAGKAARAGEATRTGEAAGAAEAARPAKAAVEA